MSKVVEELLGCGHDLEWKGPRPADGAVVVSCPTCRSSYTLWPDAEWYREAMRTAEIGRQAFRKALRGGPQ